MQIRMPNTFKSRPIKNVKVQKNNKLIIDDIWLSAIDFYKQWTNYPIMLGTTKVCQVPHLLETLPK